MSFAVAPELARFLDLRVSAPLPRIIAGQQLGRDVEFHAPEIKFKPDGHATIAVTPKQPAPIYIKTHTPDELRAGFIRLLKHHRRHGARHKLLRDFPELASLGLHALKYKSYSKGLKRELDIKMVAAWRKLPESLRMIAIPSEQVRNAIQQDMPRAQRGRLRRGPRYDELKRETAAIPHPTTSETVLSLGPYGTLAFVNDRLPLLADWQISQICNDNTPAPSRGRPMRRRDMLMSLTA